MKHVLVISTDHFPKCGGIAKAIDRVLWSLSDEFKVTVLAPSVDKPLGFVENNVVRVPLDPQANLFIRILQKMSWYWTALHIISKEKVDLIYIGVLPPCGFIGYFLKFFRKISYVVMAHASEIPTPESAFLKQFFAKKIYEYADKVICVSKYTRSRISSIAPNARCEIVHYGVDSDLFKPLEKKHDLIRRFSLENKRVLLCFGRLVCRKGYDNAIRALASVRVRFPDTVLLIVGNGPDRTKLEALVKELNLYECVRFVGAVEDDVIPDFYNLSDLFLFLARDEKGDAEGFGLVLLEAAACGIPVIAGKSGAIPEVVQDGKTGYLVDPLNVSEISNKISYLLENKSKRDEMSHQSREYALNSTWDQYSSQIISILSEIVC